MIDVRSSVEGAEGVGEVVIINVRSSMVVCVVRDYPRLWSLMEIFEV